MSVFTKTMKLHIHVDETAEALFREATAAYAAACDYVSEYVFDHGFDLSFLSVNKQNYHDLRQQFDLKSQMAQSVSKTVIARYRTVQEQLRQHPYHYQDGNGNTQYIERTLEWLRKPVLFRRPQIDLVHGRDYSFVDNCSALSINTLAGRVRAAFDVPECFEEYFAEDGIWEFGTAKLVSLKGEWYLHIPVSRDIPETFDERSPSHVVGIDRGLRFLMTAYDEKGNVLFFDGRDVLRKRDAFRKVRSELQSKGTKSAKRKLAALSGRENRWMTDVNHRLSKTLVDRYGKNTLFVIEDLTGISFDEAVLSKRNADQRRDTRSWAFYQLEQMLRYKAEESGSFVLKVPANYTSQRCPKCGRIHKENRRHDIHEYICDSCGYRSNDDRIGAMNIQNLGALYVSGDSHPRYGKRKTE